MAKGLTFSTDILRTIFWNYPITGICDAATAPYAQLYVSLHTGDPTANGDQSINEISYTGYARVPMNRDTSTWAISNGVISPRAPIIFPQMTGGTGGLAAFWVVGTSHTAAGKILYIGSIVPVIDVAVGVVPEFDVTTTITES